MRTAFRGVFGILSRGGVASVRTGAHQHTDNTHCPWQVTAGFCAAAILALLSGPVAAQGFWGGVNDGISRSLEIFGRTESLNLQREQVELERRRLSMQEQQAAQAQHQADLEASTVSQRNAARADEFAVAKQMLELAHPRLKTDGALRKLMGESVRRVECGNWINSSRPMRELLDETYLLASSMQRANLHDLILQHAESRFGRPGPSSSLADRLRFRAVVGQAAMLAQDPNRESQTAPQLLEEAERMINHELEMATDSTAGVTPPTKAAPRSRM